MKDGECIAVLRHQGSINWMKFDELTGALASGGDDGHAYVWYSKYLYYLLSVCNLFNILYSLTERDVSKLIPVELNTSAMFEILHQERAASTYASLDTEQSHMEDINTSPPGAFPWSLPAESGGKLLLAHPQLTDAGSSVPVNVLCLDICPTGAYVATGREDGVANIWMFGHQGDQCPGHGSPANTSRPNQAIDLLRRGGSISQAELEMYESIHNYLIVRLVGHVAAITDIKFNFRGDRLLTGSLKEGTARIWSFSSSFSRNEHIVLSLNDDGESIVPSALPNRRQRDRKTKNQLYNVCWSYDDLFVFTLQSGQPKVCIILPPTFSCQALYCGRWTAIRAS